MKYHYYKAYFEPIDQVKIGGANHCISFKAIDFNHALKHAKKLATWKNDEGQTVYRLANIKEVE